MRARDLVNRIADKLPPRLRGTVMLRGLGLLHIRMLLLAFPTVEELTSQRCVIRIPLNAWTRNHVGSMYLGVLTAGADLAGGLFAMEALRREQHRVSLVFKDIKGEFVRRADSHVYFECSQGVEVRELIHAAIRTGERRNLPVDVTAAVRGAAGSHVVARFVITMSVKKHPDRALP